MAFLSTQQRAFARAISKLAFCNPFLPERIEYEREALGGDFVEVNTVWSKRSGLPTDSQNVALLIERVENLTATLRERLAKGANAPDEDLALYGDLAAFTLFHRYYTEFQKKTGKRQKINKSGKHGPLNEAEGFRITPSFFPPDMKIGFYENFARDFHHYFDLRGLSAPKPTDLPHLFACFFQIRRAFYHIFECFVGESLPAANLRAAAWQSIFTHDMRRYRRVLFDRMADVTTLVTGPSGTGKEVVARAIGLSRYIPFDPSSGKFAEHYSESFFPLNLSALSPTLIESELFGHRRGAFTGALQDRRGWFEVCPPLGSVFLDEIGETDATIQVKLLRVLESRTFQRLGDTKERSFKGKVIAATNRNLTQEMASGRFRKDLYYRLCSDIIVTPSLLEQLRDSEAFLPHLVRFIASRILGEAEADVLAAEVMDWIDSNLGMEYPWPGNFRELEQCVRNIMIRKSYHLAHSPVRSGEEQLARDISAGGLTADDLLSRYCALVYRQTGNYQETARRLNLDHRTVKSKIEKAGKDA